MSENFTSNRNQERSSLRKALFGTNERWASMINHAIVALMMVCAAITVVQFVSRLFPDWEGGYLLTVTFLVTMEALYSRRALGHIAFPNPRWFVYRGTEWVALLFSLRLALYLVRGFDTFWTDLIAWQQNFVENFFTGEYLFLTVWAFAVWRIASLFEEDLIALEGDRAIVDYEGLGIVLRQRDIARRSLIERIFVVGAFLVVMAALVRADIGILWGDRGRVESTGLNVLAYFLLGLLSFTISHFASLRASWRWERVSISPDLARRWTWYTFIFLSVIIFVSILLPTEYSIGVLDLVRLLLNIVFVALNFLVSLIFLLILPLFKLFSRLFPSASMGSGAGAAPLDPSARIEPPTPIPWLEVFQSLIFWIVFLGVIGFSLRQFYSQHKGLLARLRGVPFLSALFKGLGWLLTWLQGWSRDLAEVVQAGIERMREVRFPLESPIPLGFINPRRFSPRLRVIFFYLAMLRRSRERGMGRDPTQTPDEFGLFLRGKFPEVGTEVAAITDAFVEARYSDHTIHSAQAGMVRRLWGRIRRSLRKNRAAETIDQS